MKKTFSLIAFLVLVNLCRAQGVWTQKADFGGTGRWAVITFALGGKVYIGMGGANNPNWTKDLWEWDPATNIWTQKADLPGLERGGAAYFTINGKGYTGLGLSIALGSLSDFWEYDPVGNSWTAKTNFPAGGRYNSLCFSIGNFGYVISGSSLSTDTWQYNSVTDAWTLKAVFPGVGRQGGIGFSIGTKGYAGIGSTTNLKDFWEYNQPTNTWTQKADFGGSARFGAAGFSIGQTGFVGGGETSTGAQQFWKWEQATNTWTQVAAYPSTKTREIKGVVIGNKAYVGMGTTYPTPGNDFYEYNSGIVLCVNLLHFNASCNNGRVTLDWATASETNNDHFEIERSEDGATWHMITMKDGARNSTQQINYQATDLSLPGGKVYYRLAMVELNGTRSYSAVAAVTNNDRGMAITVFPNPVQRHFTVRFGKQIIYGQLQLLNGMGGIVYDATIKDEVEKKIDMLVLVKGFYFLKIQDGEREYVQRIVAE